MTHLDIINSLTKPQLAAVYNFHAAAAGVKPVARFESTAVGAKRLAMLILNANLQPATAISAALPGLVLADSETQGMIDQVAVSNAKHEAYVAAKNAPDHHEGFGDKREEDEASATLTADEDAVARSVINNLSTGGHPEAADKPGVRAADFEPAFVAKVLSNALALPAKRGLNANGRALAESALAKLSAAKPAKAKGNRAALTARRAAIEAMADASAPIAATPAKTSRRAAALEAASRGVLPTPPDFTANTHKPYRAKLAALVALVEAGDAAGLAAFAINPTSTSPKALIKYRDLAIAAITARKAA